MDDTIGIIIVRKVLKGIVNSTSIFFQEYFLYFIKQSVILVYFMWCCNFSLKHNVSVLS